MSKLSPASEAIRQKYRLNEPLTQKVANSDTGLSHTKRTENPIMSLECFEKFDKADPTADKKFLDWMIFQAGGHGNAVEVYTKNYNEWEKSENIDYQKYADEFFEKNRVKIPVPPEKKAAFISEVIQFSKEVGARQKDDADYSAAIKITLIGYIKGITLGHTPEQSLQLAAANALRMKKYYMFWDKSAFNYTRKQYFAFHENWDVSYDQIVNTVQKFIAAHAEVATGRIRLGELKVDWSPGDITFDANLKLTYTGSYPTLAAMEAVVRNIANIDVLHRLHADTRYQGPGGRIGAGEKVYADANVTVYLPMSIAAMAKSVGQSLSTVDLMGDKPSASNGFTHWSKRDGNLVVRVIFSINMPSPDGKNVFDPILEIPVENDESLSACTFVNLMKHGRWNSDGHAITTQTIEKIVSKDAAFAESFRRAMMATSKVLMRINPKDFIFDYRRYHLGIDTALRKIRESAEMITNSLLI